VKVKKELESGNAEELVLDLRWTGLALGARSRPNTKGEGGKL